MWLRESCSGVQESDARFLKDGQQRLQPVNLIDFSIGRECRRKLEDRDCRGPCKRETLSSIREVNIMLCAYKNSKDNRLCGPLETRYVTIMGYT